MSCLIRSNRAITENKPFLTLQVLSYQKTGLCQKKHRQLMIAIERAKDKGYITYDVPFREYDYSQYLPKTLI